MTQLVRMHRILPTALALTALSAPLLLQAPLAAQETKRALTWDDHDKWTSLRSTTYTHDGKWMGYSIRPSIGDGVLYIQEVDGDKVYTFERGTSLSFSNDNKYAFFKIGSSYADERRKKLEKLYAKKETKEGEEEEEESEGLPPDIKEALAERGMTEAMAKRMIEQRGASLSEVRGFLGLEAPKKKSTKKSSGSSEKKSKKSEAEEAAEKEAKALKKRLHMLDLATGEITKIDNLKSHRLISDTDLLLLHFEKPEEPKKKPEEKKDGEGKQGEEGKENAEKKTEAKAEAKTEAKAETPAEPQQRERRGRRGAGRRGGGGRRGRRPGGFSGRPGGGEGAGGESSSSGGKRSDGTKLVIKNLKTGKDETIEYVRSFGTLADSKWLWFTIGTKKDQDKVENGLFAHEIASGETVKVLDGYSNVSGMTTDEADKQLAFTSDKRTFGKKKTDREVYLWSFDEKPARRVIDAKTPGIPADHKIRSSGLSFSRDGSVLMFSINQPKLEDLPKILSEDEIQLDLWHWQDGLLQTMQAKRSDPRKASLTVAYHMDVDRAKVLGTPNNPRVSLLTDDGSRALVTDSMPYEQMVTWDGRYSDVYILNTIDGNKTPVVKGLRGRASRSTGGRYVIWFDHRDYDWHTYDVAKGTTRNLTASIPAAFDRETDDRPEPHNAHGSAGWTQNDAEVLLYDAYDIWAVNPESGQFRCVTDGLGRASGIRFRNSGPDLRPDADRDDNEKRRWLRNEMVLSATDTNTYATGYYSDSIVGSAKPKKIVMRDCSIGRPTRPRDADRLFLTMSRFDQFPDVWTTDLAFGKAKKLTDGCPLRREVRWGKAELVHWRSDDGQDLKGYLVKPDGFDPQKKYPMMVYFYEKSSNRVHSFVSPRIGTSPNAAYYVSNGYLWFVPDINYRDGYPGESCEKCVVSGVQAMIAKGFVDRKSIGVAGHSWGGYQTAHLITRTDIFAAAESGAPVVNMFSAYGGIRWGSGMSRQFQYEKTQSRIGGTIWEYPMRYWENSPLFHLDKANTPVLILHNDRDGAVPWYQGIEFFVAMRRLGKEAYLFNYNGEDHGLRKKQNQRDWTRRMAEFFDHHLKGKPAPAWMRSGVPYHQRKEEKIPHAPSYREAIEAGLLQPNGEPQREAAEASAEAGNRDAK